MKAILVIDEMPQNCQKCLACINIQNFMAMCVACGEKLKISELDIRPSFCPAKPLPEKAKNTFEKTSMWWGIYTGWNACLDEILGDSYD